jgi:hypothetical protein
MAVGGFLLASFLPESAIWKGLSDATLAELVKTPE